MIKIINMNDWVKSVLCLAYLFVYNLCVCPVETTKYVKVNMENKMILKFKIC